MYRLIFVSLFALGNLVSSPQEHTFPQSAYMTPEQVREAMAAGTTADVSPYRLHDEIGARPGPTAAVYTPFVRVALAAKAAQRSNDDGSVPPHWPQWVTAPNVIVVFARPCGAQSCQVDDQTLEDDAPVSQVGIARLMETVELPRSATAFRAVAVTRELAFLDVLGGPPFENAILAATFEPEAFRPGLTVFASWTLAKTRFYSGGVISANDLRHWR